MDNSVAQGSDHGARAVLCAAFLKQVFKASRYLRHADIYITSAFDR